MSFFSKIFSGANLHLREADKAVETDPKKAGDCPDVPERRVFMGDCIYVPTVNRCVKLISESIASMPVEVEGMIGDVFRPMTKARLYTLMRFQPNSYTSSWDFWAEVTRHYLLDGLAAIIPYYGISGQIERLCVVNGTVTVDKYRHTYSVQDEVLQLSGRVFQEHEIIIIRNSRYGDLVSGFRTLGRNLVSMAEDGDNETLDRLRNGGAPRMLLTPATNAVQMGSWSTPTTNIDELAEDLDKLWRGKRRVLGGRAGLDAKLVGATSAELQLQSLREFTVREICRMFGVPPIFVYSDSTSNYKTVEMAYTDLMTNTIDPILRCFESELTRKLISPDWWTRWRIRFDRMERQCADMTTYAEYLTKMMGVGAFSVNDIRRKTNLPPVPAGDTPLVSANLKTIDEITNQQKQKSQNA